MKKLVLLLAAFVLTASFSLAAGPRGPISNIRGLDKQLERIEAALGNEDLSDRKKAFLESKKELLTLQVSFRDAVKEAIEGIDDPEAKRAAAQEVRAEFADDFKAFKETRRANARERREARGAAEGDEG